MTDVFVSYATSDRARAESIVQALEARKLRVFWDRSIPAGRKWQDVLEQQLRRARCVLVLLTRDSIKSSWVSFEASIALERRIIVPLIIDGALDPQRDLPEMYRDLHVIKAPAPDDPSGPAPASDLLVRSVRDTVRRSARRRLAAAGALALLAAVLTIALLYMALTAHNTLTLWQAGIGFIERGAFSKEENERLQSAIRSASTIDLIAPNATAFTSAFRDDLPAFLGKPGARMRVLFADPDSAFYDEMMTMTNQGIERNQKARESDQGLPARSKQILLGYANQARDKIAFRQFNTEFRMPMILVDGKSCFLTLRLTPDQAKQSLRIELADPSAGPASGGTLPAFLRSIAFLLRPTVDREYNAASCKRHFDAVWDRSKEFE